MRLGSPLGSILTYRFANLPRPSFMQQDGVRITPDDTAVCDLALLDNQSHPQSDRLTGKIKPVADLGHPKKMITPTERCLQQVGKNDAPGDPSIYGHPPSHFSRTDKAEPEKIHKGRL